MRVVPVKMSFFSPYATFWKTQLVSGQIGIFIKYLAQLKLIYYHRSGNKNTCRGVCKFGIINKWKNLLRMGQWSRFWQLRWVSTPRHVIWYKNLNLLLKGCICPNALAIIFFFHNLTCWRYEVLKNNCPIRWAFFLWRMGLHF